jgi:hypothetical protein
MYSNVRFVAGKAEAKDWGVGSCLVLWLLFELVGI